MQKMKQKCSKQAVEFFQEQQHRYTKIQRLRVCFSHHREVMDVSGPHKECVKTGADISESAVALKHLCSSKQKLCSYTCGVTGRTHLIHKLCHLYV